ncbi:unnamed protein product [Somion occarium]
MLDFMFAVTHASHWHSINMNQFPGHYPLYSRMLGSSFVSRVEDITPGVWFNAFVPMKGVTIKYGVTTVDNLCSDLLNWNSLYLAGRMHKPIRIIKDDARVRLTQQVNLTSAIRTALLTLPENFSETELFERIAGFSYAGDIRMLLPAENRDLAPHTRAVHLRKLPKNLLSHLTEHYASADIPPREVDESMYWTRLASDPKLSLAIQHELEGIVRYPSTVQTIKGVVSAGFGKSLRYAGNKVGKWWKGFGSGQKSS